MRVPPSGRVPEQGPDWVLVATEASSGETLNLLCSPIVLGYMEIYIWKKYVRGATRVEGAPRGGGRAPFLMDSSEVPRRALQVF